MEFSSPVLVMISLLGSMGVVTNMLSLSKILNTFDTSNVVVKLLLYDSCTSLFCAFGYSFAFGTVVAFRNRISCFMIELVTTLAVVLGAVYAAEIAYLRLERTDIECHLKC